jgi:hypothetical protein
MTNPIDFLTLVRCKLSEEGLIIGTVPNYNGLGRIIFGVKSSVLLQPEHVIYFDHKSLKYLLEKTGFTPIFIGVRKPNGVIIDLSIRRTIFKYLGRNQFSVLMAWIIYIIKKYLVYPVANIYVEKTGKLAHGLTFVAKPSGFIGGGDNL